VPYSSKVDPLVKQTSQGQEEQKNLLEKDQEVDPQSNPRGSTILVEKKQDNGKPVENVNGQQYDEDVDCHPSYPTHRQK